ncbi:MAG: ORF6N domain-containing protein [Selenomonadaceae bacterium]|nr:ORF6N domain-containing protein [Selenomonadaceae bacterium]
MKKFKVPASVEWNGQRVLLNAQLAECYNCSGEQLRRNFGNNRTYYQEGVHYFKISSALLGELQRKNPHLQISPKTRNLYLWTERGAARHAKMLSDDKAWDVFELLRESYFSKNDSASAPHSQPQEEGGSAENLIQIFEHEQFGKIRVIGDFENPLFCLADVCRVLELPQVAKVVQRLGDEVLSTHPIVDSMGRIQQMYFVNEDGFYDVLFDSRKPIAKRFRKWVTRDVLPKIRKTGSYSIVEEKPKAKSKPAPNPRRRAAQLRDSHVYAFLMSDNTVKIGIAGDVEKRMPQIERQYKLTVVNWHYSPLMTRKDALKLEAICQKIFSPYRTEGEFFSVNFRSACALIDSYSKIIDERSDLNRAEKILIIVDMMGDSFEKQKLLISSGKLIAGEKFS